MDRKLGSVGVGASNCIRIVRYQRLQVSHVDPSFHTKEATMRYVWQYLQSIGHGGYLNKPLDVPKIDPILPVCSFAFAEIPPDQRYKNYLKMIKRLKRKQQDDS